MATVTIQATGSSSSTDNFTITIIDYLSNSRVYNNTDTNKVSRATLYGGYNVSGITVGDTTVRATSSGTCTTYTDADVTSAGLQTYTPPAVLVSWQPGTEYNFVTGRTEPGITIGTFSTYGFLDATDFSVTYVSQTGSTVTNGPLTNLTVVEGSPGSFSILGDGKSLSTDNTSNTTTYKLTYNSNGNSRTFTFAWLVSNQ